jgi:transcription initiation factor IIE alpha subunit
MIRYIDENGITCVRGYFCPECEQPYEQDKPGKCPDCGAELDCYDMQESELIEAECEMQAFREREERKMAECDGSW